MTQDQQTSGPNLSGRRVAFLTSNAGVEHIELTGPWKAVHTAGGEPVLIAPKREPVHTVEGHEDSGVTFDPSATVSDVSVDDFAAVVIPGGVANPDALRLIPDAVDFVRAAVDARMPIASICHGPWMLVEAGVLGGKTLTSWPSLATDIRNAGGTWQDVEVFTCTANDWTLITSRKPDDLDAFNQATIEAVAGTAA